MFKKVNDNFERVCMMIFFMLLFVIVCAGIVSRLAGHPFSWTEEAARLCFIWLVFMGLSYGTKYDKHINVTIFLDKMPKKVAAFFYILWDLVGLAVFIYVSIYGVKYIGYQTTAKTPVLQINMGITTSIIAVSAILNCIRIVEKMIKVHIPAFKEAK
ncbi:MAG: TRAP transporter small permease [Eubacteriales bacterium]|nr:TRAP transporter small permease [Eubacteriales bacterium]